MKPKILGYLKNLRKVTIVSHIRPDGDTVGSALFLYHYLKRHGVDVSIACRDQVPKRFQWLPGAGEYQNDIQPGSVVVTVDVPTQSMVGFDTTPDVVVDHHGTNDISARVRFVESSPAMALNLALEMWDFVDEGLSMTKEEALCLLVGLHQDTGGFSFSNATSKVFYVAGWLLRRTDIEMSELSLRLSSLGDEAAIQMGKGLASLKRAGRVVFLYVESTYAGPITRVASQLDADLIVVRYTTHEGSGYRVELRSPLGAVNVAEVAQQLGGGGHPRAAGFVTIDDWDQIESQLVDVVS